MSQTKKIVIFSVIGLAVIVIAASLGMRAYTKSFSQSETVVANQTGLKASLKYSRPSKKGREIFGKLVPYRQVWRTGANEATEITFDQDVNFGGKPVKAGTYALFTIPTEDSWTIILNSVLGQWGHYTYDQTKDVLRIEASPEKLDKVVEVFTISFEPAETASNLVMRWDSTQISVPITQ